MSELHAGSAAVEITPHGSVYLAGYPDARRYSTGVHDPLFASALYLKSGSERVLIIANDVIYVSKRSVARIRQRLNERTRIPAQNILISATHTHSGPKALDSLATTDDPNVAKADPGYVQFLEDQIVEAGALATRRPVPSGIGLAVADATGIGTNRRDPAGPRDLDVPVLVVRSREQEPIAAMLVCSMHPTVLHEDSTLISGDFPGVARQQLQKNVLGRTCPVLYHTGPAGNQSPRHVVRANTFDEAERLGRVLADAVTKVLPTIKYRADVEVSCRNTSVMLPLREFPSEADAIAQVEQATRRLEHLRTSGAPRPEARTAEVDLLGAQETLTLARLAIQGRVAEVAQTCMPAEIQAILIGPWTFIAWPGEMFVEFALQVKSRVPKSFVVSYANGELQGYLVTRDAVEQGGYEASNAIFKSPESGDMLVARTLEMLSDRTS